MARMTQTQINHLSYRIRQLTDQAERAEVAKLGEQPDEPLSNEEKMDLIRRGKAKLLPSVPPNSTLVLAFTYPMTAAQRKQAELRKKYREDMGKISAYWSAERTRLVDMAILGDSEEAMQLLGSLELRVNKIK